MPDTELTGVAVTYNDSLHLEECLSHLSFCDELVVVDLGSTDDAVRIAERFNARVVFHDWVPVVELARQFAVNQANSDWVVFMDPDLIFPDHLANQIKQHISANDKLARIMVPYRNYFMGHPIRHGRWGGLNMYPAIIHRQRVEFPSLVHGGIGMKPGYVTLDLDAHSERDTIRHYWVDSWRHFFSKHRRYVKMEGESRFVQGKRFTWRKCMYSVAREIYVSLFRQRGIVDNWQGVLLSVLWGWYTWEAWLSLRRYQHEKSQFPLCLV